MACEHCGRPEIAEDAIGGISVGMQPGKDGQPWQLCVRCWRDGLRSIHDTTDDTTTTTPKEK